MVGPFRITVVASALTAACVASEDPDAENARSSPSAASPEAPAAVTTSAGGWRYYLCADDTRFLVREEAQGDRVRLVLPDTTVLLPRIAFAAEGEATSDAAYREGAMALLTEGSEFRLERGGEVRTGCVVDDSRPWGEAARRGVDFRATGNEPGWYLEIDHEGTTLIVRDYGEARDSFPTVRPEESASGARVYRYEAGGGGIAVRVEERPCRDSMSGFPFEAAVTLRIDGRELRGCGRRLEALS